jgi:hypothetical protein
MKLPIDVGQADVIVINQGESSDTGSAEGLRRIAADSTQPEDGYGGFPQAFESCIADQQFHAAEAMVNI